MIYVYIALIIIIMMSVSAFVMYSQDKRLAIKNKWRIPERALLLVSLLCGGIGGYIAMFVCHHKTKKWYFHVVNILGIILSVALMIAMLIVGGIILI